ncbi:MAG: hypothetical protein WBX25_16225, partial [Rhodomicrobium sp.]
MHTGLSSKTALKAVRMALLTGVSAAALSLTFRAVPELIESEGIHKEAEAVESALVQDGGSDGLFEGSAGSID